MSWFRSWAGWNGRTRNSTNYSPLFVETTKISPKMIVQKTSSPRGKERPTNSRTRATFSTAAAENAHRAGQGRLSRTPREFMSESIHLIQAWWVSKLVKLCTLWLVKIRVTCISLILRRSDTRLSLVIKSRESQRFDNVFSLGLLNWCRLWRMDINGENMDKKWLGIILLQELTISAHSPQLALSRRRWDKNNNHL